MAELKTSMRQSCFEGRELEAARERSANARRAMSEVDKEALKTAKPKGVPAAFKSAPKQPAYPPPVKGTIRKCLGDEPFDAAAKPPPKKTKQAQAEPTTGDSIFNSEKNNYRG